MAAGRNIKGITIEIGGDTTGLQKALSGVNDKLKNTQAQLKDVNNLLKLDPSNTVLVAQKQELLKNAIADTASKLDTLEAAQKDVTAALEAGKIGQEEYMAFQREVEATKATLSRYQSELDGLNTEQDRLATNTERLSKLFDALGADVDDYADVLGSKLVTAIKNGSASSDQLKTAIEKIGKSATGGKADIKQMTDALDTVDDGQAIRNLIQELKDAGTQADNTSEQLDEMGETLTGGAVMMAAEKLSGVGDKIQELGEKAQDAFLRMNDAATKASTYFGETGEAAEKSAAVIKNIYEKGVGDSMDSVANAVVMVKKNIENLDETDLTNLTEQAMTLDDLYGIDMNETLRGVNGLMVNFGMTAQEAMDYIVKGTQNGLDKTNELGDNLAEYSGKFADAGYSAEEYFQILQNGLEGGAYNLDKVNDAINEVTTRLAPGAEIESALDIYSEKTRDVFKAWQDGKATQKDVINSIVDDIAGCQNQQEQLNMAATAFGTMAEDGSSKFITSLTTVGDTFNDVNGAAQNMFDNSTTDSQTLKSNMRKLQDALIPLGDMLTQLANEVLPPIVKAVKAFAEWFAKLPAPVQNFTVILGILLAAFTALTPIIAAAVLLIPKIGFTILPIIGIIAGAAAVIAGIIEVIKNWGEISEWLGDTWEKVKEKCKEAWDAVCKFFTETIPQAWDSLKSKFESIPEWWSGIWQQVADFFSGIWQSMSENPVLSSIVTTIQDLWQNAVTTLQGIWSGLTEIASGAWELLKNTILAPVLLLIDLVTGDFTQLASDAQNIWQNIQDAASQIWSGIQQVVTSFAEGLATHVVTLVTGFMDTLSSLWNMIKQTALNTWENLKDSVVQTAQNLKESAIQAFHNMVSGIGNALSGLGSTVQNGFQSAISFITSLPDKAYEWGADFVHGIAQGIRNAIGEVTSAARSVADSIRSFLHFSVPDEGPLTDYESWMPDFMQGLAKGIEKSKSVVTDAIEGVSKDMTINANAMMDQSNAKQTNAIMNITSLLAQYLPYLAKSLNIEWDTGGVAAKLARDMDRELGILAEEGGFL
ncbi:MAG: phage tail tape measure protein [Coprococcus sp.]|jgi:TP901 family phage tail tape measure protein